MAHIFKKPTKNNKGIIVYTHKELEAPRWKDLTGPLPIVNDRIAERYHIGMHYGAVPRHFGSLHPHVSFVMASKNQVTLGDKNVLHVPMNSRNFLPDFFKPRAAAIWNYCTFNHFFMGRKMHYRSNCYI